MTARGIADLYRRAEDLQRRRGVRVSLSVVALLLVIGVSWPLHSVAGRLAYVEAGIVEVLAEANVASQTAEAMQLLERGTVDFEGREYGDGRWVGATQLFDESGALFAIAAMAETLAAEEIPAWCPTFLVETAWTPWGYAILFLAFLLLAVWSGSSLALVLTAAATAAIAVPASAIGWVGIAFAVTGIGVLGFGFVLLVRLILAGLDAMGQIGAVGSTVVREAIRQKGFVAFIIALLVVLPMVPLLIDPESPLRYQLQTFIGRSLGLTFAVSACLTLVLGCATVAFEIRDRQIMQLMTKPIGRARYLVGKWLGIMALDAVLLAVCGLSIFIYIQYLQTRPASDAEDAMAVRDEVLVARLGELPQFDLLPRARLLEMVDAAIDDDPILREEIDRGERDEFAVRRDLFAGFQTENLTAQRSVAPGEDRTYVFRGLGDARARGDNLTLRYRFWSGMGEETERLPVVFRFDQDGSWTDREFVPGNRMTLIIPASMIDEEGVLSLAVVNVGFNRQAAEGTMPFFPGPNSIRFDADGLEILYPVSSFEANFLRTLLITWIKLGFLAMLGVGLASVLSFPVACLAAFAVFLAAEAAPFLAYSLDTYRIWDLEGNVQWGHWLVLKFATGVEWIVRTYGATRPNPAMVEGRLVGWDSVLKCLVVIGVGWSGFVLLLSILAFRRKELAVYSGQS